MGLTCVGLMAACGGDDGGTDPPEADVTGTWIGTISSSLVSESDVDLFLTQSGADLTGHYVVGTGAEGTISGTVNGEQVTFTLTQTTPGCEGVFNGTATVNGTTMTFTYSGNDCLGSHTDGQGTLTKQSDSPEPPPTTLDGTWSGTTSQGNPLSFTVSDRALTTFTVGYLVQGSVCTSEGGVTADLAQSPVPIVGDEFSVSIPGEVAVAGSGTFTSASVASGTLTFTLDLTGPPSCTGSAEVTWNAGKGTQPATATQLAFSEQPTTTTAGVEITPAVQVTARDAQGNTATGFTGNVTVAIGANPSGATLSGTTTVAAVAGVATFGNLSLNNAGTGYTLTATASGLTGATSATFNIAPTAAITRLYLSPLLDFKLRPTPTPQSNGLFWCVASTDWSATLADDMVGTAYTFNLGVQTDFLDTGSGTLQAEIIHKRGSTETILAATTFTTTTTYEVQTATLTGPDPDAQAGDTLSLRVLRIAPSPGLPCVVELAGLGTDSFIEVPTTTVETD